MSTKQYQAEMRKAREMAMQENPSAFAKEEFIRPKYPPVERDEKGRFKPGVSGNPGGLKTRPETVTVTKAVAQVFAERGVEKLREFADAYPKQFYMLCGKLIPGEMLKELQGDDGSILVRHAIAVQTIGGPDNSVTFAHPSVGHMTKAELAGLFDKMDEEDLEEILQAALSRKKAQDAVIVSEHTLDNSGTVQGYDEHVQAYREQTIAEAKREIAGDD